MSYLYEAGKPRRVMHLQRYTPTGVALFEPLCGMPLPFNRSVNVPLGRRTCRRCFRIATSSR